VLKLSNCKKCNIECIPVYRLVSPTTNKYVCRDCALITMEDYYDRRPDEIEESD
jgi:transcription initiation factor TFIIIB Brf1 subunit/transcription initiation factor TFIIB